MKLFWFIIMLLTIPLDFIGWNLMFGSKYGCMTFKETYRDSFKEYEKRTIDKPWFF